MPRGTFINPNLSLEERFWLRVDKTPGFGPWGDCWRWTGSHRDDVYGIIMVDGKRIGAHRVAYFLQYGIWPEPVAMHKCDTPACVRWDHIVSGSWNDNRQDAISKGRMPLPWNILEHRAKTHCPQGHPYDEENTRHYRGYRYCRECHRIYDRARKKKLREEASTCD
jgi:hypothetical protein